MFFPGLSKLLIKSKKKQKKNDTPVAPIILKILLETVLRLIIGAGCSVEKCFTGRKPQKKKKTPAQIIIKPIHSSFRSSII